MNCQLKTLLVPLCLGLCIASAQGQIGKTPASIERAQRYLSYIKVKPGGEALRQATAEGRLYTIDLLLDAGVPIDDAGADGTTALMVAAKMGAASTLAHLLEKGAAVDAVNLRGETALMAAVQPKDASALHTLLDAGASVDLRDNEGRRALHRAILAGRPPLVEALLQAGAQVFAEEDPEAPLAMAWAAGDVSSIQPLVERSAPAVAWTPATIDRFWAAYRANDAGTMDLLQRTHATPPELAGAEQPLLVEAVLWQDAALISRLLQWGANPDTHLRIPASENFIHATGKPELTFYLQSETGMTALMLAGALGCTEGVAALLDAGASRNAQTDRYQMVAQHFAGRTGNAESLQLLLGQSPKPEDQEISIRISISAQMATLYKKGVPLLHTSISTGTDDFPTPTGRFVITDKHRRKVSTIYDVPMPFFMRLSGRDFGLHEGHVPGYAASHGCIRVPAKAARELFKIASVGTLVTIDE